MIAAAARSVARDLQRPWSDADREPNGAAPVYGKEGRGAAHSVRPSVRELAKGSECRIPYQFRVIAPIIDFIETNRHTVRIERH